MEEQEKIELYLNDALTPDEHKAFEQELANNPALAEKVAFNRGLMNFFEDYEPELEDMLSSLGEEHFTSNNPSDDDKKPPNSKGDSSFNLLWLLPILLLMIVGIYWYSPPNESNDEMSEQSATTPSQQTKLETIQQTIPEETVPENDISIPEETTPNEPTEKDIIVDDDPKIDQQDQPIASIDPADYEVNPILETLLTEQVRATDYRSSIDSPKVGQEFKFEETIALNIKGQTTAPPPYELLVYSNNENDFDNDYRTLTAELDSQKEGENYPIKFNAKIPLERGLYYWILRTKDEDILYVSKFTVK